MVSWKQRSFQKFGTKQTRRKKKSGIPFHKYRVKPSKHKRFKNRVNILFCRKSKPISNRIVQNFQNFHAED